MSLGERLFGTGGILRVRAILAIGVMAIVGGLTGYSVVADAASDLTKVLIGGWLTALGNVISFYFMSRERGTP